MPFPCWPQSATQGVEHDSSKRNDTIVEEALASMQSASTASTTRMPCVYINHGGGPMPLLGRQPELASFLRGYAASLPRRPTAILIVTAHWETKRTTVSGGVSHQLLFDYGGFPPETYKYRYPAPGNPTLALRVRELLAERGLPCDIDRQRGWDHGVFVPLMLMFPEADVPVVAMSLLASQDAAAQTEVGAALQPLREEGVLIVGSGASFHNFGYFFAKGATRAQGLAHSAAFDAWLRETMLSRELGDGQRAARVATWAKAPSAREAHPDGASEHLMPLFAIFGAGGAGPAGRVVGDETPGEDPDMPGSGLCFSQFEFS